MPQYDSSSWRVWGWFQKNGEEIVIPKEHPYWAIFAESASEAIDQAMIKFGLKIPRVFKYKDGSVEWFRVENYYPHEFTARRFGA